MGGLEDKAMEANQKAFREQLPKLLETNEGKFAVGRVGDEFTCWDTYRDAVQDGCNRYGGVEPFLVKKVERFERHLNMMYTAAV